MTFHKHYVVLALSYALVGSLIAYWLSLRGYSFWVVVIAAAVQLAVFRGVVVTVLGQFKGNRSWGDLGLIWAAAAAQTVAYLSGLSA